MRVAPRVSVLTPTWERAEYLHRVWQGLSRQTYLDFEWIVANDGSTDNTDEVVRALASKSNFPVTLINASCRIGKSRMDNELVKAARGDFGIWCDSDDYLYPNALEKLIDSWNSIPLSERSNYCGVTALCETQSGVLGQMFYESCNAIDLPWNELYSKLNSDLVILTRIDLLRDYRFLEVDFLIPESSVWNLIGTRMTRFEPNVLQRKSYGESNCLSYSGVMAYSRGRAYALAVTRKSVKGLVTKWTGLVRTLNYLRYCSHGEIPIAQALRLWEANSMDLILLVALLPFSRLLAAKDCLQRKVKRTHRDFEVANKKVQITVEGLNFYG